jgi:hypothetical protein
MPNFLRGVEALQSFDKEGRRPRASNFCKELRWKEDGEKKYIRFLNPQSYIAAVDIHEFIPVEYGTGENSFVRYESFIDRRDSSIGERTDELTDRLEHQPKRRVLAAAVELEPLLGTVNGRKKPVGFTVATEEYTRTNEDGTTEDVLIPKIGIITQSKFNFYVHLATYDEEQGPIEEAVFQITRIGKDTNTAYNFIPFDSLEVDFSPLIENWQNSAYASDLEIEADPAKDAAAFALELGAKFLDKRLMEMADKERYDTLVGMVEHVPKYGESSSSKRSGSRNASRPQLDDMISQSDSAPANDREPTVESKVQRLRKQYAKA